MERRYWIMKTFKDWWSTFSNENIIAIDEQCIDRKYTDYSDEEIITLIGQKSFSEYIDRSFREFCMMDDNYSSVRSPAPC